PQAQYALEHAEHVVGYAPYVAKVPVREGQRRHASGNRVEADRAADALRMARDGARVAVVSSRDPGVFAMGSAVYEQAEAAEFRDVVVRVLPGVTAAQEAAARVGAPLGHDFCVLSLSDRLKPWEIIERRLDAAAAAQNRRQGRRSADHLRMLMPAPGCEIRSVHLAPQPLPARQDDVSAPPP